MGLLRKIAKSLPKPEPFFIAESIFEDWANKPADAITDYFSAFKEQVKRDNPGYFAAKSDFNYIADGNIVFHIHMKLKNPKGALSITRK